MSFRQATVAEIETEAARMQVKVGNGYVINPNGYGIHIRCTTCGESATRGEAYRFSYEHSH